MGRANARGTQKVSAVVRSAELARGQADFVAELNVRFLRSRMKPDGRAAANSGRWRWPEAMLWRERRDSNPSAPDSAAEVQPITMGGNMLARGVVGRAQAHSAC